MNIKVSLFGLCLAVAAGLPGSAVAQSQSESQGSQSTQGRSQLQQQDEEQFGQSSQQRQQRSREAVGAGEDTDVEDYMRGRLGEEAEQGEEEIFGDRPETSDFGTEPGGSMETRPGEKGVEGNIGSDAGGVGSGSATGIGSGTGAGSGM